MGIDVIQSERVEASRKWMMRDGRGGKGSEELSLSSCLEGAKI